MVVEGLLRLPEALATVPAQRANRRHLSLDRGVARRGVARSPVNKAMANRGELVIIAKGQRCQVCWVLELGDGRKLTNFHPLATSPAARPLALAGGEFDDYRRVRSPRL